MGEAWGEQDGGYPQLSPSPMPQLNDAQVRATKPTPGKTTCLYDSGGLHLLISPTGSKAWRLKYRYNGKENRISLGAYPLVSLKEARQSRVDARRQLLQGINPSAERKARRQQREKCACHCRHDPHWRKSLQDMPRSTASSGQKKGRA